MLTDVSQPPVVPSGMQGNLRTCHGANRKMGMVLEAPLCVAVDGICSSMSHLDHLLGDVLPAPQNLMGT